MGEAKKKKLEWMRQALLSKPMLPARFNLYAIGTRRSPAFFMSNEIAYWSDLDERLLGLVFQDVIDEDFAWMLLARDRIGRFRCVEVEVNLPSPAYAARGLRQRIAQAVETNEIERLGDQGDETNYPTDLLAVPHDVKREELHPNFRLLLETPGRAAARAVFKEIGPWLAPSDPHFVSEFQRKQFDQRLWELYLWAAFRELGFDVTQPEAPDFLCERPGLSFTVEATTVAPSRSGPLADRPDPKTPEEMRAFLTDYMPMKFGSSLTSKLTKKNRNGESYWERGDAKDRPFVLAIADFHVPGSKEQGPGSMTYTQSALPHYLYGHRLDWEVVAGTLVTRATKTDEHVHGTKAIPSGFFDLPGAENISAVLFSNVGTLAKFDRMGVAAGFGAPDHRYFRFGTRLNRDPNSPIGDRFVEEVGVEHEEGWADELQLFHNPNARNPLPERSVFPITEHFFKDGHHLSYSVGTPVLGSFTMLMQIVGDEEREVQTV
jgi:hypothetical protein